MVRGRKPEFDRAEVLRLAADHFWDYGFEGSSITDLQQAMGISRQSLYSTFGDKHSLFVEAMDSYFRRYLSPHVERLGGSEAGFDSIRRFFQCLGKRGVNGLSRGCLLGNSIAELAPRDAEVAKLAKRQVRLFNQAFLVSVTKAQERCDMRTDLDARTIANLLTALMQGCALQSKLPGSKAFLRDGIGGILDLLRY